jgi:SAM-dependent methyltransferase
MSYTLDQAGDPTEWQRLALLQNCYDPKTIPKLEQLGVAPGWCCFDVGAGAGSIARWLAERVAPNGCVLAIDLDTTLLDPLASPTISVKRMDIRCEELPEDADLVHSRLLLEHLPDRQEVLLRMVRALRPGGWILLTDTDFRAVRLSEADSAFDRLASVFAIATEAAGWNMQFGPELPSMLESVKLTDVAAECWQSYGRGNPSAILLARTYRRLRNLLIRHGADPADIDHVETRIASANVGVFSPMSWMAWGRRQPQ